MSTHGSTHSGSSAAHTGGGTTLNVYKKVAVIRKPTDTLAYEDTQGQIKTVSAQELGDAIAHATPISQPNKVAKQDIPVPRINHVESYLVRVQANYQTQNAYVRYHKLTDDDYKSKLEYVFDEEDEAWLRGEKQQTKFGTKLTVTLFERMMDALETETAFDVIITLGQADHLFRQKIRELYTIFAGKPRQGHVTAKHVLNDVYTKRSKLKRPLLRRFWPVTSTDDTNPHLVFRPREKEKYKLRKKRQNDMEAYNKMRQLRSDFDNMRAILQLVKKREELNRLHLQMQIDLFQQRLHDVIDTSGQPRESKLLHRSNVKEVLDVPSLFDVHGRRSKRPRTTGSSAPRSAPTPIMTTAATATLPDHEGEPRSVAGQNFGTPAPHFLQPLYSREDYATSWQEAVPYVDTFIDAHAQVTFRYRHRTRVGRGGRLCIDRVPQIRHDEEDDKKPHLTVFTAGKGLQPFAKPKAHLLDLLPRPLDHLSLSRRVEELSVAGIIQDYEARMLPPSANGDPEDNDADEVIVRAADWKDTDGQLWGEERFILGNDDD